MTNHPSVWLVVLIALAGLTCLVTSGCTFVEVPVEATPEVQASIATQLPPTTTASRSTPSRALQIETVAPAPTSTRVPESQPTSTRGAEPVTITVVYDNNPYDLRLQTAWGFAGLIERGETTILFDTGGDGALLLSNMATLGLDPHDVDIVVLSHIHGDHTGGLSSLLTTGARPTVYVPRSFPEDFKAPVRAQTHLVEVHEAVEIADGVYTTGEMGLDVVEQALVLKTARGLVVVTGCAHPGIVEVVRRAKEIGNDEVYLVLGGFHLDGANVARVKQIIADFQWLGVQKVAPCHCTGARATILFADAYGQDFIQNGVGQVLEIARE